MRKALIVGVDYYEKIGSLHGCVNDALAVAGVLEEHANHGTNFITPNVLTATSKEDAITRRSSRKRFGDSSSGMKRSHCSISPVTGMSRTPGDSCVPVTVRAATTDSPFLR